MPEHRGGGKVDIEIIADVPYIVEYELVPKELTPAAPATASPDPVPEDTSSETSESDSDQADPAPIDAVEAAPSGVCLGFRHSLTHFPKDQRCEVCIKSSYQRRRKIKGGLAMGDVDSGRCKKFGDQYTADYLICYDRLHPKPSPSAPAEDLVYD